MSHLSSPNIQLMTHLTWISIFILLLLCVNSQTIHLHHLVQNGNFEDQFRHWATHEPKDTQQDLILPKLVTNKFPNPPPLLSESTNERQVSIHMDYINERRSRRQGIMQAIFHSQSNKLSDIRSPLLISFAHIIQNLISGLIIVWIYIG